MSRWLESVDDSSRPAAESGKDLPPCPSRLRAGSRATGVMLFGEATRCREKTVSGSTAGARSNGHRREETERTVRSGSSAGRLAATATMPRSSPPGWTLPRTYLEIEPVLDAGQELRLESICVAGKEAASRRIECHDQDDGGLQPQNACLQ